jgi:biopolymer transport protein ExbB/biopolymer transport protein TolQ
MTVSVGLNSVFLFLLQTPAPAEGADAHMPTFLEMIGHMGWPARIVGIILCLMSIYSISVMIERWLTFNSAQNQSRQFITNAAVALRDQRISDAIGVSEAHKRSHLAIVVNAGLQEYLLQREDEDSGGLIDAVRDSLERARAIKAAELTRGLPGLATIGSTAPFVGLLGTVIGIINCFQGMKSLASTGITAVAGGISEALIETALGLVVAIPAVWMFNHFNHRVDSFKTEMNNSSSELMVYLKRHHRACLKAGNPG